MEKRNKCNTFLLVLQKQAQRLFIFSNKSLAWSWESHESEKGD